MLSTVERVDRSETVFASFMERADEALADIRATMAGRQHLMVVEAKRRLNPGGRGEPQTDQHPRAVNASFFHRPRISA